MTNQPANTIQLNENYGFRNHATFHTDRGREVNTIRFTTTYEHSRNPDIHTEQFQVNLTDKQLIEFCHWVCSRLGETVEHRKDK